MWRLMLAVALVAVATCDPLRYAPADTPGTVICPDKMGTCPTGSTCCKLKSGRYGCCSFSQATCCSDHLHCCPHGYTCDVAAGTCDLGDSSIPMVPKQPARPMGGSNQGNDVLCPGGQYFCPGSDTCCKLKSGNWGCCPLPKAVCCADGVHCCPTGYQCDSKKGTCSKGANQNTWFTIGQAKALPATPSGKPSTGRTAPEKPASSPQSKIGASQQKSPQALKKKRNVCPGGKTFCEAGRTCCYKNNTNFGCCSYVNGTCCSDMKHCCPLGYNCDIKLGKCTKGGGLTLPWGETQDSKSNEPEPEEKEPTFVYGSNLVCPDGHSYCPDTSTCCMLPTGEWGCCPMQQAVCCSDDLHCCPHNTQCNVAEGTCDTGPNKLPWVTKQPALPRGVQPWVPKVPAVPRDEADDVKVVTCFDEISTCPDDYTCCQIPSGVFKCCPMINAVCCQDHEHCCPQDTVCNIQNGTCEPLGTPRDSALTRTHAPSLDQSDDSITCDDKKTTCQEGTTCCKMLDGYYSCCPFPNAVCCPDKLHCCPHDESCDIKRGRCVSGSVSTPWGLKLPPTPPISTPGPVMGVVCPGGQYSCPTGNTCCQEASGVYACCPIPQAVCCSDHVHCCPHGYTCDVAAGTCTSDTGSVPLLTKTPPVAIGNQTPPPPRDGSLGNIICPDKQSYCPDKTTCCRLTTGQYGCCPLPQATCCADNEHCCPSGYTCDTKHGSCMKASESIPWSEKVAAQPVSAQVGAVVCPDKKSQCQDGQTCCMLPGKVWGCCPIPQAVCCSDGLHCCPNGMRCDVSTGMCLSASNSLQISMSGVHRTLSFVSEDAPAALTQTCKDKTECPEGSTCCQMTSGKYGCCPYASGTCCSDKIHCCPSGFLCDPTGTHCEKKDSSLQITSTMFTRFQASPPGALTSQSAANGACPGGQVTCSSGQTCCQGPSGDYACCPFADAVCCSDHTHCCPNGYACDTQTGTCTQAVPWVSKIPAVARQPALEPVTGVMCPDHQHECPDGNTCCKLVSGEWGCCPLPQAVCCSDGQHCCPHGYRCQSGTCLQTGDDSQTWQQASLISMATRVDPEE